MINKYLYECYGNAGSPHKIGRDAMIAIGIAKEKISVSFNAEKDNIIFTSSGSEANTLAILGLENHLREHNKNHIITSAYEHASVYNAMKEMERRGFDVTYLDTLLGVVDIGALIDHIRADTGLVSIMYVNNEVGTVNNVEKIYEICQNNGVLFHCDCVQAAGVEKIDLRTVADSISVSGHKIHAPKGIGCLCVKNKGLYKNIICGGQQEYGLRPGTENVAFIASFGEAIEAANSSIFESNMHIYKVSSAFKERLLSLCIENSLPLCYNIDGLNAPKIISIRFDGVDAETLVLLLSASGVYVSAGSACSSHETKPSRALKAVGLTDKQARETIRVSFSNYNTIYEAVQAAEIIADCVIHLLH